MTYARVPLEQLQIAEPCHVDWDGMTGDEQRRFCGSCGKHVHDLSTMTRGAAEELVCQGTGRLCLRISRDNAGQVITLDSSGPPRRRWVWGALSGVLASLLALPGCQRGRGEQPLQGEPMPINRTVGMIQPTLRAPMPTTQQTELGDVTLPQSERSRSDSPGV